MTAERVGTAGAGPARRGWSHLGVGSRLLLQPAVVAVLCFVAARALVLATLLVAARWQGRDAHRVLVAWDGQWYAAIAEHGYAATSTLVDGRFRAGYAFFPLLPGLERAVAGVSGIAAADVGLVVSAVTSVLAAWGIFTVAARVHGDRVGVAAVVLWALLPVGVVESMAYSESLFTALAAWTLASLLADRWVTAGTLACLAGLTRPAGAALAGAVVAAAAVHVARRLHEQRLPVRPIVAAVLAPLGWVGYVAWVGVREGSLLGYFEVEQRWGNGVDGGAALARWTWRLLAGPRPVLGLLVLLGMAAVGALYYLCVSQRQPLALLVFSGLVIVLALVTSGYFGSRPRYLLPAFPLLLPLARQWARRRTWASAGILLALTVLACGYAVVWLFGTGPP